MPFLFCCGKIDLPPGSSAEKPAPSGNPLREPPGSVVPEVGAATASGAGGLDAGAVDSASGGRAPRIGSGRLSHEDARTPLAGSRRPSRPNVAGDSGSARPQALDLSPSEPSARSLSRSTDTAGSLAGSGQAALSPQARPPVDGWYQLPPFVQAQYVRLSLPVSEATLPSITDEHVVGRPRPMASGTFNTVFAVKLQYSEDVVVEGIFKPLRDSEFGASALSMGVPIDRPRTANRNMASEALSKELGFDVIVPTCIALLSIPGVDGRMRGPMLGLMMQRAPGQLARHTSPEVLSRPNVMREVTKLQLLDHLCAQGDRHAGNYFVAIDAQGRAKVTGIDNDQCFGAELTDPDDIRYSPRDHYEFRGTRMPPVVDSDMANAIRSAEPARLRGALTDLLSPAEIDAVFQRLHALQEHIESLDRQGLVIPPDGWGQREVRNLLWPVNSYAGRDLTSASVRRLAIRENW